MLLLLLFLRLRDVGCRVNGAAFCFALFFLCVFLSFDSFIAILTKHFHVCVRLAIQCVFSFVFGCQSPIFQFHLSKLFLFELILEGDSLLLTNIS